MSKDSSLWSNMIGVDRLRILVGSNVNAETLQTWRGRGKSEVEEAKIGLSGRFGRYICSCTKLMGTSGGECWRWCRSRRDDEGKASVSFPTYATSKGSCNKLRDNFISAAEITKRPASNWNRYCCFAAVVLARRKELREGLIITRYWLLQNLLFSFLSYHHSFWLFLVFDGKWLW